MARLWTIIFLLMFLLFAIAQNLSEFTVEYQDVLIPNLDTSGEILHSEGEHHACPHGTMGGRNLIVSIDGSANQFGEANTNVIELYNLILKDPEHNQRTWYNSGIGTYARPSWKSPKFYRQVIHHKIDLAIAWDFEQAVMAAYRWLSDNYEYGDRIFLFGFSRGAFQVRTLSAMIDKVGLIYKGNEMQIPFAYELYADPASNISAVTQVGSSTQKKMSSAERFKKAFSYKNVKVHFVGAWDTVSSIGIVRGTLSLPGTVDGMKHVCYFRHALALDERRVKFLPEYAYGGSSRSHEDYDESNRVRNPNGNTVEKHPHSLEVWFAGTHSDIGGGNTENAGMDRSRPPLRWMVFEAEALGLRTAPFERELSTEELIEVKESLTTLWWPFEFLPIAQLTYRNWKDGKEYRRMPHLGAGRIIHEGQKIHSSLLLAGKSIDNYTPKAYPLGQSADFWRKALKDGLGPWLQLDMYDYVDGLVKKFVDTLDDAHLQTLRQTVLWADGKQAVCDSLYKAVISALQDPNYGLAKKRQLLQSATEILRKSPYALKKTYSDDIRALVSGLPASDGDEIGQHSDNSFLVYCTDSCLHTLQGHTDAIRSVDFLPDSLHIVSNAPGDNVRLWDLATGKLVKELFTADTNLFKFEALAISTDSQRALAHRSDDETGSVWLWSSGEWRRLEEMFRGHAPNSTLSGGFSPDGNRIVLGFNDYTVCIWDLETNKQIGKPLRGHKGPVVFVGFLPDGTRVVSRSLDTVRIWSLKTGKQVGEAFKGNKNMVRSLAFSPDSKYLASGFGDNTIRIWDLNRGKQAGEAFQGHVDAVTSVAYSPDGKRLVSGSSDRTVRIWMLETGKEFGEPFMGHTDTIKSVTFSPDGKQVVSGSEDRTIRVWGAEMF